MSFQLTQRMIRSLCGQISYERGQAYHRARKITLTDYDPETSTYEAMVNGKNSFRVSVKMDRKGALDAECTCPSLDSYDNYCQHIAAVLLHIHHMDYEENTTQRWQVPTLQQEDGALKGDIQLTSGMLELFSDKPQQSSRSRTLFDSRETLAVEFTCKPFSYSYQKYMFGIEMKIGHKRLYTVQKLRELLGRIDRGEVCVLSKHFTYDPQLHSFEKENEAVIRELIEIYRNEKMYSEAFGIPSIHANNRSSDRMLLIPAFSWEPLLRLLLKAPTVKLEEGENTYQRIRISEEPIPLHFEFDQTQIKGYQLDVQGLDTITVMESYGMVLSEGRLLKLSSDHCKRLADLKQLLDNSRKNLVEIPAEQMESFMEKVLPGLMKLGSVHVAQTISDRIMQTPLKAKLYLDRVKDRLLAGLEFQYGDIVINPIEGYNQKRGSDRILMRDGEKEKRILDLMEKTSFTKTEGGYFMRDEEGEYNFLYHTVPELEKLVTIYATSTVKIRLLSEHVPPKVTIDVDERIDWLEFKFEMEGIPESEIRNLLKSLEEKRKYHRLPNGALLPLESREFQEISRNMDELGVGIGEASKTGIRLPLVQGLHLVDASRQRNAVTLGKSFRRLLENMRNPDNMDFPVPDNLAPVLRDYQKYGFQWMRTLAHYRFGGILADDMGLGKTLQSIAFISSVLPDIRNQELPALIISPSSLLYNWRNELKKFAPEIRVFIVDGSTVARSKILKDASQVDVIITSYPLLRRDIKRYRELSFNTLILDEAQTFKNHTTQTAKAVKGISAKYRFALTGTPVENMLEDLWSIFDVVFPELFPSRKVFNELPREMVAKRVGPFLLRRLKADVLKELPEKIESVQASELLPEQKKLYVAYLAELQQETVKHLHEGYQKNRIKILAGLTRLRQLCCHPALFVEGYAGSSAKFEQLLEMVEQCQSMGKRVLVFSQFTEMLGLIGRELGYRGVPFFYLDGQTPTSERVELCSRFNEGVRDVFLISLKAGGTGLNLTGADTVILYDLWWNPAVEQQAADRAHRIGQKNIVQVIRLVTQGTVEDKMYELQQRKKNLIDAVIGPGQEALSSLTEQEIREILMIG